MSGGEREGYTADARPLPPVVVVAEGLAGPLRDCHRDGCDNPSSARVRTYVLHIGAGRREVAECATHPLCEEAARTGRLCGRHAEGDADAPACGGVPCAACDGTGVRR